jgi:hypothetical protein
VSEFQRRFWRRFLVAGMVALAFVLTPQEWAAAELLAPPAVMHFCAQNCATLILRGDRYVIAKPGSLEPAEVTSVWVIEKFTRELVLIHRTDPPNPANGMPQLKLDYSGHISAAGNTLINVSINGNSAPNARFAWGPALESVPGSNAERDQRNLRAQQPTPSAIPPANTPEPAPPDIASIVPTVKLVPGQPPSKLASCIEGGGCAIWSFSGNAGSLIEYDGFPAKLTVVRFDKTDVVIKVTDRHGVAGEFSGKLQGKAIVGIFHTGGSGPPLNAIWKAGFGQSAFEVFKLSGDSAPTSSYPPPCDIKQFILAPGEQAESKANAARAAGDVKAGTCWDYAGAQTGNPMYQKIYGYDLMLGRGVEKDVTQSFAWFLNAGLQGEYYAQKQLSGMYDQAMGTAKDNDKAAFWNGLATMHNLAAWRKSQMELLSARIPELSREGN